MRGERDLNPDLVVGAVVRVDISGCHTGDGWHIVGEHGVTGKIVEIDVRGGRWPDDHGYWVWFERPVGDRRSWSYAAHELQIMEG